MKAETKNQAFALYVHQGMSLRKITNEMDVSRSTLERWCREDQWVEKRRQHWLSMAEKICEQQVQQHIGGQHSIAGKLHEMVRLIHTQHMAYYEGKIPRSAIKYTIRDLCRLAVSVHQIGLHEVQRAEVATKCIRKN